MGFLLPAALGLLALAIPVIIFYMLRLRREEVGVPSSMLWRRVLLDRTANTPFQRLRRNLLLFLQLLLLLLLVCSLARPFVFTSAVATGNLVVVLDASASMQTKDEKNGSSRFDRARQEASALVDGLQGDSRMALVWAGPSALTVVSASSNKSALHSAINGLSASNGGSDMQAAVTLAAASARELGDSTVVLVSDGAFPSSDSLPVVPSKASYINVGTSAGNLAITALSLRDSPGGPQLFASTYNSGGRPASGLLSIEVDGKLRDSRQVTLGSGEEQTLTLTGLPLDTRTVHARLAPADASTDLLAADDEGWAVRPLPPSTNVLLVSVGNSFLEKSLGLVPGVKLFKSEPSGFAPSPGFGITVLDSYMPVQVPAGNLLIFAPPDSPLVPVSGTLQYPAIGQVAVNDPLLRFVDLSDVHIAQARKMSVPPWARVLARTAAGDPLIIAGETGGRRVVAVAFDVHQSDLPLKVAFPILVANFVEWLQPSSTVEAPPLLAAGDPVSIRALPEADEIVVTDPAGKRTTLQPSGRLSFAGTDSLGIYSVEQRAKGKPLGDPDRFAVNLFSKQESDIAPQPSVAFRGTQASPPPGQVERPLEIWPWLLLASLLLLAVEWWVYNRGSGIRGRGSVGTASTNATARQSSARK